MVRRYVVNVWRRYIVKADKYRILAKIIREVPHEISVYYEDNGKRNAFVVIHDIKLVEALESLDEQ